MMRDTLEMIPVAILLAVILAFGAETGHARSIRIERNGAPTATMPRFTLATVEDTAAPTLLDLPIITLDSSLSPEGPSRALAQSTVPRLFLDWKERLPGVPAFTSADIPRISVVVARRVGTFNPSHGTPDRSMREGGVSDERAPVENGGNAGERTVNGLLYLNRARISDLMEIPGIGSARARLILDRKPGGGYRNWNEVDALPGFGEGTVMMIRLHAVLD